MSNGRRPVDPALRRLQARLHRWELPHLRALCAQQAIRIEELELQLATEEDAHRITWFWLEQEREVNNERGVQRTLTQDGTVSIAVMAPPDMDVDMATTHDGTLRIGLGDAGGAA